MGLFDLLESIRPLLLDAEIDDFSEFLIPANAAKAEMDLLEVAVCDASRETLICRAKILDRIVFRRTSNEFILLEFSNVADLWESVKMTQSGPLHVRREWLSAAAMKIQDLENAVKRDPEYTKFEKTLSENENIQSLVFFGGFDQRNL